jgi:hypothetical protein
MPLSVEPLYKARGGTDRKAGTISATLGETPRAAIFDDGRYSGLNGYSCSYRRESTFVTESQT